MEKDDVLCLELLMNNSKKRCGPKISNSYTDTREEGIADKNISDNIPDKNIRVNLEPIINSLEMDINNSVLILSNFDLFMNRLLQQIKTYIRTFEKEFNGKQD